MAVARLRVPPGPTRPILGTLITPGRDPLKLFTRLARSYGDIVHFRLAGEPAYFLNHPQYIRDVLVTYQKDFKKSRGLERAQKLLGNGLLTAEGAAHLGQRRLIQPAFHRERLASYASVMVEHADRTRSRWGHAQTLDVSKEMMRVTLSIVGKTLFDTDVESKADDVGVALTQVMQTFFLSLLPGADFIEKLPIPVLRRSRAARERLDALIYQMIADRRASGVDHGDLLSTLLAVRDDETSPNESHVARPLPGPPARQPRWGDFSSANGLTDQQIRDESMTLMLAGHETTANALTWAWYLLSENPDVESKLHAEIDSVLGGRLPSMADIPLLPFVERVVAEAIRLYPPAWVIGRRALAEYTVGGYVAPARALFFMSPYITHRDARFFPDPERFDPDRWTPEFKLSLPPFAYFPFGGGARKCIGDQFALMETALVLTTIAQKWQLGLVPGHRVVAQPLITLRAKHGMKMTATRRTPSRRY